MFSFCFLLAREGSKWYNTRFFLIIPFPQAEGEIYCYWYRLLCTSFSYRNFYYEYFLCIVAFILSYNVGFSTCFILRFFFVFFSAPFFMCAPTSCHIPFFSIRFLRILKWNAWAVTVIQLADRFLSRLPMANICIKYLCLVTYFYYYYYVIICCGYYLLFELIKRSNLNSAWRRNSNIIFCNYFFYTKINDFSTVCNIDWRLFSCLFWILIGTSIKLKEEDGYWSSFDSEWLGVNLRHLVFQSTFRESATIRSITVIGHYQIQTK